MKSKLLQKISYGVNQSREVVDGQQENDSSRPTKAHETPRNPANPAVDAQACKDFSCFAEAQLPISQELSVLQQTLQTIHIAANMYSAIPQHLEEPASAHGRAMFP
jgi:hypothetical protein